LLRNNRKLRSAYVLCIALIACASLRDNNRITPAPSLELIVDDFAAACDARGLRCTDYRDRPAIHWGDIAEPNTIGVCETIQILGLNVVPSITISHKVKDNTPDEIRSIVYHELAHCYFFVDHHEGDEPHLMRKYYLYQYEINKAGGVEKLLNDFFNEYKYINDL
jgi:hypothetical protein